MIVRFTPRARGDLLSILTFIEGQTPQGARLALLSADQRPHGLDWHQHDAFAERGANEAVAFVEAYGRFVDRMGDNAAYPGNLGCRKGPP